MRDQLLAWWEVHCRHAIPWKRLPDGRRPAAGEELDPYAVLVVEVMRAARQHSSRVSPASPQWTEAGLLPLLIACLAGAGGLGWPHLVVHFPPSG